MENDYQWYYDDTPDLSGDKSILYYLDGGGLSICPAKEFYKNKSKEEIENWTWEKECNKLKNNFNAEGKLFYCYFPDRYYNARLRESRKIIDDMNYQNPKNNERGALWIFNEGESITYNMLADARQTIKYELFKRLPDDIVQLCEYFLFD